MNIRLDIAILVRSETLKESIRNSFGELHNLSFVENFKLLEKEIGKSQLDLVVINTELAKKTLNKKTLDLSIFELSHFILISEENLRDVIVSTEQIEITIPNEDLVKTVTDGLKLSINNLNLKKLHEDAKRFAPRIVHEIRNPCSIIKNSIENLKQCLPKITEQNLIAEIDRAMYGVSKLEEIMSTMMVLDSGAEVKNLTSLTIDQIMDVIKQSSEDLVDQFNDCPAVAISAKPFDSDLIIKFEPIQLQQIIFNLLKNAYQAQNRSSNSNIRVTIETVHSQFLNISVIDNGPGIPESIRGKIFRTNFTTKVEGHSQGIGLALCRKIAHKNKAELMLDQDSEETKFDLLIPFDAA